MESSHELITAGIITVSDRASSGTYEDRSGPLLERTLLACRNARGESKYKIAEYVVIPDEREQIASTLRRFCDELQVNVAFTTGGTGFATRDVTPEATRDVIEREANGLATGIMVNSLKITPFAMLSRAICGIRKRTLIINLPGSPKAVTECLASVEPLLEHAIAHLRDDTPAVGRQHAQHAAPEKSHQHGGHDSHKAHSKQVTTGCSCTSHTDELVSASKPHGDVTTRERSSRFPLVAMDAALNAVFDACWVQTATQVSVETTSQSTDNAGEYTLLGRVLADDVHAGEPFPPFVASVKDGYAVRAADGAGVYRLVGAVVCGGVEPNVGVDALDANGKYCVRITTGAPLPSWADAVVQVEDTRLVSTREVQQGVEGASVKEECEIEVCRAPQVGLDVRPVGSDIPQGETILSAGSRIGPCELALLGTFGTRAVRVHRPVRIGVLSTGDELVHAFSSEPGALPHGVIRDTNRPLLLGALRQAGFGHSLLDLGIVRDSEEQLIKTLDRALRDCDVILSTGGASMGEHDLVKRVLIDHFHAELLFGRIFMKPGKPTACFRLTTENGPKLIFCLPGNPVSASVTFSLFVLPAVRKISGMRSWRHDELTVRLDTDFRLDPRPEYARAVLEWPAASESVVEKLIPVARLTGNQISSRLLSVRNADCLVMMPPASESRPTIRAGELVRAVLLR